MGGKAKGLLPGPGGEPIVSRWVRIFGQLGIAHVLVGEHPAYTSFGIPTIPDDVRAPGPVGGLLALLEHANVCSRGPSHVIHVVAVACDMPHVSETLVRKLIEAAPAPIVAPRAPREGGFWEPFFARYDVGAVLPVARVWTAEKRPSLQGLLNACGASELPLDAEQLGELRDWDAPEDIDCAP